MHEVRHFGTVKCRIHFG